MSTEMDQRLVQALDTWRDLNDYTRDCGEDDAVKLLEMEIAGQKRRQFAMRIHSRINKLRAEREREEIKVKIRGRG